MASLTPPLILLLSLFLSTFSRKTHFLVRLSITEYPESKEQAEIGLRCNSWRFAVEANNLNPWRAIPSDCTDYVKAYMTGRAYVSDLERVSKEADAYAKSFQLTGDGKDVWIFDIDETLLSNLPYYTERGYGLEVFNQWEFDRWVDLAVAPAINSSLRLYEEVARLGFKVILLAGRGDDKRRVTVKNLMRAGYRNWDKLILRAPNDVGKRAVTYKTEKRIEMVKEGYRIIGNIGDQWSDLLGCSTSVRSFKVPNPMYYIP